ncbi:MAG TPA: aminoglycoside phosphotransferase family protein [Vicinamibacterales bacterium]|nr:aminoglycoside phosphotransferase family protein [Vicinamibacterales bacterium]
MPARRKRPELVSWAERALGHGARVLAARRLSGGLTSRVRELTVAQNGRRRRFVLRSWEADPQHQDWVRRSVATETTILTGLQRSNIPAPRLIAFTTDVAAGGPAVLMTRVPGRILLMPRDRDAWLRQMAQMLARVHALDAIGPAAELWLDVTKLAPPPDASRADIWREAFAAVAQARTPAPASFIHRDYQHFNLLWSRERLTGVVDWGGAGHGPPDLDVGHCRLNLTLLFSVDVAERFRELYELESGRAVDPYWDLHALLSYGPGWQYFLPLQIDGRAPLDAAGMTRRMEDVLSLVLRRM